MLSKNKLFNHQSIVRKGILFIELKMKKKMRIKKN